MSDSICFKNVSYFDYRHDRLNKPIDISIIDGRLSFNKVKCNETIDASDYVMIPSFAQLHVHLCQHLYKGIAEDVSLFKWLEDYILPYEMNLDHDTLKLSAQLALYELIDTGTTAIMDMGTFNNQEALFEAIMESGIRAYSGNVLMDRKIGKFSNDLKSYISYSEEMIKAFHQSDGDIRFVLCPRFLPGITDNGAKAIKDLQEKYNLIIHIHASETQEEIKFTRETYNAGNIEVMNTMKILNKDTVIAHGIYLTDNEMELLKTSKAYIAHCPSANMKLGSGIAQIAKMINNGIHVGLGTDGAPCNNNNNQLLEMRISGLLQKVKFGSEKMKANEVLKMATYNGFQAMHFDDSGIIEHGKSADILLIRNGGIHKSLYEINPAANLIYSSYANDIEWVLSKGKVLKRNGNVTVFDNEELEEKRKHFLKNLFPDRF